MGSRRVEMDVRGQARLLSYVDAFQELPEEELLALARRTLDDYEYDARTGIFGPEDGCENVYVLKRGRVHVTRGDGPGSRATLDVIRSGSVFGTLDPDATQQGARAEAVVPSLVCTLPQQDLESVVRRSPGVGLALARSLDRRLRTIGELEARMRGKEAPARLAIIITRLVEDEGVVGRDGYKVPARYTHEELGAMIGSNRDTVTRALSRLRAAGLVETPDGTIVVPDLDALERTAEG
ncbi:helix-turn-helix domain-containing protein [Rubrobacter marinus]|uniref:Helix-turn-helix domain-containing protein n=1 Tax=Rubrobacter marinus TaxID=2653852 RepID=A0A6G8PZL2_9ACTN|nr:Crp/Fnr family transcriptional regulator [Rubrobacter marinus]QIN79557.1 helix-turn-helix domain-containing protein [Rubrobacter marinus]